MIDEEQTATASAVKTPAAPAEVIVEAEHVADPLHAKLREIADAYAHAEALEREYEEMIRTSLSSTAPTPTPVTPAAS